MLVPYLSSDLSCSGLEPVEPVYPQEAIWKTSYQASVSSQENEGGRILEIHLYYLAMAPSLSVSLPGSLSVSWDLISLLPFTDLLAEPSLSPLDQLGKATLLTL